MRLVAPNRGSQRKNLLVAGGVAPQTTSRFLNGLTPFRNNKECKIPASVAAKPCPASLSALCSTQLGVLIHQEMMQRLTARFLLLFALVGTILPAALQATATPQHACCRRQAAHHCHDTADTNPQEPVVRGAGCCHGDCSRSVTTARWAHPQPRTGAISSELSHEVSLDTHDSAVFARFLASLSTRAPPLVSIA